MRGAGGGAGLLCAAGQRRCCCGHSAQPCRRAPRANRPGRSGLRTGMLPRSTWASPSARSARMSSSVRSSTSHTMACSPSGRPSCGQGAGGRAARGVTARLGPDVGRGPLCFRAGRPAFWCACTLTRSQGGRAGPGAHRLQNDLPVGKLVERVARLVGAPHIGSARGRGRLLAVCDLVELLWHKALDCLAFARGVEQRRRRGGACLALAPGAILQARALKRHVWSACGLHDRSEGQTGNEQSCPSRERAESNSRSRPTALPGSVARWKVQTQTHIPVV